MPCFDLCLYALCNRHATPELPLVFCRYLPTLCKLFTRPIPLSLRWMHGWERLSRPTPTATCLRRLDQTATLLLTTRTFTIHHWWNRSERWSWLEGPEGYPTIDVPIFTRICRWEVLLACQTLTIDCAGNSFYSNTTRNTHTRIICLRI